MSMNNFVKTVLLVSIISLFFFGCENAEKEPTAKPAEKAELKKDSTDNADAEKTTNAKPEIKVEKLTGTWVGTLDKRKTTLTVTEEESGAFKGKITINYRTPINQEIEGEYNSETKVVTMKDLLHSRYKGTYEAKLIEDQTAIRGVFTTLVDKKKFDFILTKQK